MKQLCASLIVLLAFSGLVKAQELQAEENLSTNDEVVGAIQLADASGSFIPVDFGRGGDHRGPGGPGGGGDRRGPGGPGGGGDRRGPGGPGGGGDHRGPGGPGGGGGDHRGGGDWDRGGDHRRPGGPGGGGGDWDRDRRGGGGYPGDGRRGPPPGDGRYGRPPGYYPPATQYITCTSYNYSYNECFVGGRIANGGIYQQLSNTSCAFGYDWGMYADRVWVTNGCSATFYLNLN